MYTDKQIQELIAPYTYDMLNIHRVILPAVLIDNPDFFKNLVESIDDRSHILVLFKYYRNELNAVLTSDKFKALLKNAIKVYKKKAKNPADKVQEIFRSGIDKQDFPPEIYDKERKQPLSVADTQDIRMRLMNQIVRFIPYEFFNVDNGLKPRDKKDLILCKLLL